jgi:hypothetical protein
MTSKKIFLADARFGEASVVFDAHLTASEQIGHGCDSLLRVFGAGADRENEIAERQLGTSFQDLGILLHMRAHLF